MPDDDASADGDEVDIEVDIEVEADRADDTLTDHHVVEIETDAAAPDSANHVVEDDDAEGVHAP